jgi:hypothetical protein
LRGASLRSGGRSPPASNGQIPTVSSPPATPSGSLVRRRWKTHPAVSCSVTAQAIAATTLSTYPCVQRRRKSARERDQKTRRTRTGAVRTSQESPIALRLLPPVGPPRPRACSRIQRIESQTLRSRRRSAPP